MTTIMSIDAATKKSGVAIFVDKELVYSCCVEADKKERNSTTRIEEMFHKLSEIADRFNVDYIIFEDAYCGQNAQAMKQLSRLHGCIMAYCFIKDKGCKDYLPAAWRHMLWSNFGNKREEQKMLAVEYANENFGLSLTKDDDDEAEAICIGAAFCTIIKEE